MKKLVAIVLILVCMAVPQNSIFNPGSGSGGGSGTTTGPGGTPTTNDILTSTGTAQQVQDPGGCTLTSSAFACPSGVTSTFSGQIMPQIGSASAPAISWAGNNGFYKASGNNVNVAIGGSQEAQFISTGLKIASGSGFIFGITTQAGLFSPSSDVVDCGNGGANDTSCTLFVATLTPSTGITGVSTNSSAPAGDVGELISSQVVSGSAVSLTSGTAANITSVSLTAGDWDCSGAVDFNFGATTSVTNMVGSFSQTSATVGPQDSGFNSAVAAMVPTSANPAGFPMPVFQELLSGTTTIFLVAKATFTVSTTSAYGTIRCRRIR